MRPWLRTFLTQPEVVDEDVVRLALTLVLVAAALFFFRLRALTQLTACAIGGALVLGGLWAGFHRLGLRVLGGYWPGAVRGAGVTLLVFCLLPPGLPWLLALLLGALAVAVEAVEKRALVPLALSGVMLSWTLGWLWQTRTGAPYIAPFDLHVLDEPITLWVRFQTVIEPVRSYAGQVAGPLGATSFGLAAIATLLLSYARAVSWHLVAGFYGPVLVFALLGQRPLSVYLLNGPALVFVAVLAADPGRLPRSAAWRLGLGLGGGAIATALLLSGAGAQAFGAGVVVATALVTVFQFFGLAGSPGAVERHGEARRDREPMPAVPVAPPGAERASVTQLVALALFLPAGLLLVWRDASLDRGQRRAVVSMGALLYAVAVGASLAWFWVLRLPS
ncbi:MAG: hypothetical protein NVSMB17_07740 [Candidatus Dormibacteria bacterium]